MPFVSAATVTAQVDRGCTHRLLHGASGPDCAGELLGQHHAAEISKFRKGGVRELAVARGRAGGAAGSTARVKDGSAAGCAPRIEFSPVVAAAGDGLPVDGAVFRVVDGGLHAAAAAVFFIGVGATLAAAIE